MKTTSFVMGLIGGIFCCLFSTILVMLVLEDAIDEVGPTVTMVLLLLSSLAAVVGASIVLKRGAVGGMLMIVSYSLIFILAIAFLSMEYFQGGLESFGGMYISFALMGLASGILGYVSRNVVRKKKRTVVATEPQYTTNEPGETNEYEATNESGAKFCTNCGTQRSQEDKFCPNCGSRN